MTWIPHNNSILFFSFPLILTDDWDTLTHSHSANRPSRPGLATVLRPLYGLCSARARERESNVTVPGVHETVPVVNKDHSVVVFAANPMAPTPQRRAPPRHGGVRFRREGTFRYFTLPQFLIYSSTILRKTPVFLAN